MIEIRPEVSLEALKPLKSMYLEQTTTPLDGMWLAGFVPSSQHYGFYISSERIGYCCVNDDGYILQFYVKESHQSEGSQMFSQLASNQLGAVREIHGAFASTAEPHLLAHCFDAFSKVEVNALMYQLSDSYTDDHTQNNPIALQPLDANHIDTAVNFAANATGAPTGWLREYYENLVNRRELFGYWESDVLVATGERRLSDEYQPEVADLGVIVSPYFRDKGLATRVLQRLVSDAQDAGQVPICSTERRNIAAQKAISRAGFVAYHRIVKFWI